MTLITPYFANGPKTHSAELGRLKVFCKVQGFGKLYLPISIKMGLSEVKLFLSDFFLPDQLYKLIVVGKRT